MTGTKRIDRLENQVKELWREIERLKQRERFTYPEKAIGKPFKDMSVPTVYAP